MKKTIFLVFLLLVCIATYRFLKSAGTPYPYLMEKISFEGLEEANQADILIIGDRMGEKLTSHISPLLEKTGGKFRKSLNLYNWSRPREGLHRTLAKLRSLSQWPSLVIYHGASEEYYEKKIHLEEQKKILQNFQYRENEIIYSLVILFPPLSRIIYHPVEIMRLNEKIIPDETLYTSMDIQKKMEAIFKIFQYEMEQLVDLARSNKSRLLFLTTPLNLNLAPKKICHHSITSSIVAEQQKIANFLQGRDSQQAWEHALALTKKSIGNARSFFLASQAAKALGHDKKARDYGNVATSFDCETWRGNAVFNAIIQKSALTHQIPLLDFNYLVNRNFAEESFFDEIFPADFHYQKLGEKIIGMSMKSLGL